MAIPAITQPEIKTASAGPATPPAVSTARVKQLQDLRWGMFICWSFSTFSGKEWTPGVKEVSCFKPTGCA
jgi:alpha-L-fucosidase